MQPHLSDGDLTGGFWQLHLSLLVGVFGGLPPQLHLSEAMTTVEQRNAKDKTTRSFFIVFPFFMEM